MGYNDEGSANGATNDLQIDEENITDQLFQAMVESSKTGQVPKNFIQPPQKRLSQTPRRGDVLQLPLVDLARMEDEEGRKHVISEITRACEEWGFVQVINHGVPPALMDAALDFGKKFFALPAEAKQVYKLTGLGVGYGRIFNETSRDATVDWNDRFYVTSYGDHLKKTDGTLALAKLTNPPGSQELVDEYGKEVYQLLRKMLAVLSEGVGQPSEFFFDKVEGHKAGLRLALNYYPPCPAPDLVMGMSAHEDSVVPLTFIQQDDVAGLEVLKDGAWVTVQPIPHAFVMNIGDVLQMISNGRFKSVSHRGFTNNYVGRLSISNFCLPSPDTIVQPAPELCSETEPPRYKPVTHHDLLVGFLGPANKGERSQYIKHFELN